MLEAGGAGQPPTLEAEAWRDRYLDRGTTATADLSVTILAGSTLGGGTTVNWTTTFAPPARAARRVGVRARPHRLRRGGGRCGHRAADRGAGSAAADRGPGQGPRHPRRRRALGWEANVTRRNAGPCTECGGCGFGCARGAKRSTPNVHLAAAAAAGARVVADARVTRIVVRDGIVRGVGGAAPRTAASVRRASAAGRRGGGRPPDATSCWARAASARTRKWGETCALHPTVAVIGAHGRAGGDVAGTAPGGQLRPVPARLARPRERRHRAGARRVSDRVRAAASGAVPRRHSRGRASATPPSSWTGRQWAPLIGIIRERGGGRVRRGTGGRAVIDTACTPPTQRPRGARWWR